MAQPRINARYKAICESCGVLEPDVGQESLFDIVDRHHTKVTDSNKHGIYFKEKVEVSG